MDKWNKIETSEAFDKNLFINAIRKMPVKTIMIIR